MVHDESKGTHLISSSRKEAFTRLSVIAGMRCLGPRHPAIGVLS